MTNPRRLVHLARRLRHRPASPTAARYGGLRVSVVCQEMCQTPRRSVRHSSSTITTFSSNNRRAVRAGAPMVLRDWLSTAVATACLGSCDLCLRRHCMAWMFPAVRRTVAHRSWWLDTWIRRDGHASGRLGALVEGCGCARVASSWYGLDTWVGTGGHRLARM